ncbi:TetR/AcrR family transcriptional regulator [Nocardia amikacinitolerans]|uniref:TetR/AcrR family transcriptional regulator n=1 Tax=Nocardia amikacinitolerans TaxID=756689 RepID=UPI0020A47DE7|nr:TetR/AcrR family transcriptional regulator [Nocardia amikacinitolerans]MCP2291334.1 transcriptional regulator, TetR family [Nocardia amikacinitolerans]
MCASVNIEEMTKSEREGPYHHGDLRNALVRAAAELAETGGPEAVTVRAAARRVGVTPTAAYRHFTNHDQLLGAAQEQAQQSLFDAMAETIRTFPPDADAVTRLFAVGRGYIVFALREPGLFRTAFCNSEQEGSENWNSPAFDLLSELLDELVEIGFTDPEHRPDAEFAAWSAVHGIASLLIERALPEQDPEVRDLAIARALAVVERGLATGPKAAEIRGGTRHTAMPGAAG